MFNGSLSRRDFLKLGSAALLSLLFAELQQESAQAASASSQGRVQATNLFVRDTPSYSGKKLSTLKRDDMVDIAGQVFGGADGDYNRQWYRLTNQTYVYSGYVQSVKTTLNPVVTQIPESGVLGEITIPYAD